MGFMHATPAAQQAFLPVIFRPTSFGPGPPGESTCGTTKIVARLHAANLDASVMEITRKWPWVFKQPGRFVELPAEEAFEGFDELLLDEELLQLDGTDDKDDQASSSYSKVSREVRKACHTFVSLDAAPAPEVVMLSEAAARLTGIPFEAMRATSERDEEVGDKLDQIARGLTGTSLDIFVGAQPFSSNYGGHQFGNWAGQLGDGRVCTLGEIQVDEGVPGSIVEALPFGVSWSRQHVVSAMRWHNPEAYQLPTLLLSLIHTPMNRTGLKPTQVQLKGIGQTPFSRNGDGKAGEQRKTAMGSMSLDGWIGVPCRLILSTGRGKDFLMEDL